MDIQFDGMDELMQQIERMGSDVNHAKNEALTKGAEHLREKVQSVVRVMTGNLKANIEISEIKDGEIEVFVDNQGDAYYGHMLEFGTSRMRAYPFMYPAFQRSTTSINRIMANTLRLKMGLVA